MPERILVADDNEALSQLLELILVEHGYEVTLANDGSDLLAKAQLHIPDLMIVDILMPRIDGYEAIRQLRNDTRLAHIPIIVLTARTAIEDVVTGFELGADDYIVKPFQMPELLARVRAQLLRATRRPVLNPLTGLPGNILIEEEVNHRLRQGQAFALLYLDLDNFKAYNDSYGFARGDLVIKLLATILSEIKAEHNDEGLFIGHIGGDDFAIITLAEQVNALCEDVIRRFDQRILTLYDPSNSNKPVPIQTLSVGVVLHRGDVPQSYHDLSRIAAEMKRVAKQQTGSVYVVDRRSNAQSIEQDRRKRGPTIGLLAQDASLIDMLSDLLQQQSLFVVTAESELMPDAIVLGYRDRLPKVPKHWQGLPQISLKIAQSHDEQRFAQLQIQTNLKPTIPIHEYLSLALHLVRLEAR
ncbi:response regulator [Herpetosiphon sp. NSE202]|uniref:GGDEF domain-containing response regulator n=1 Tax=Herpetosiphon sp. NSE202 TaxID=3351349 RepID=UPI003635A5CC